MAGKAVKPIEERVKPEPKDTGKLVEKMRSDPIFKLAMTVIKARASTVSVSVTYEGDDEKGVVVSGHLQKIWDTYLDRALQAVEYGRQAFEIVSGHEPSNDVYGVADLVEIPFELSQFEKNRDTKQYDTLKVGKGTSVERLSIADLWVATIDATPLEPFGKSRYRGAPWKVHQRRETAAKRYDTFIGRFALGFGLATAPDEPVGSEFGGQGSKGEIDEQGEAINPQEVMAQQLEQVVGGGWLVMSSKSYKPEDGGGSLYSIVNGPEIKDGSPMERLWSALDVMALRSMGVPERSVIQSEDVGARAVADAHQSVLNFVVEDIVKQIITTFDEQIVQKVSNWNDLYGQINVNWTPIGDATEEDNRELVKGILTAPTFAPGLRLIDLKSQFENSGYALSPTFDEDLAKLKKMSESAPAPNPLTSMFGPTAPITNGNGGRFNGGP